MINIDYFFLFVIYLGASLIIIIGLWVFFELKQKKIVQRTPLHDLKMCEYCHFPYLALSFYTISRCPQCHCYNQKQSKEM